MIEVIFDQILKALSYLLIAGIVVFAYKQARDRAKSGKFKEVLLKGFLWCGGIAIFASLVMGTPSCESDYGDPIYGGCDYYADNGYDPTVEQRIARFAYFMTLLYIPVVIGAYDGHKKSYDS